MEVPIDQAFALICDFDAYERSAMRRGAEVRRVDDLSKPGVGMKWAASFKMRGKKRNLELEMTRFDQPTEICVLSSTSGINGTGQIELLALSRGRTRILVEFELKPTNLSARLLVQSLKLAKNSLTKRYKLRVAEFAKNIEDRHKA
ncbi:SRPBCC family protein [Ascidiaceihabitans sp.]|nr:SRPBCC family protein [Ascidiaceihabitans sp.]